MRAVGIAGLSDGADRLAALHVLPDSHEDLGEMTVVRGHAAAVVDRDHVAAIAGVLGDDDATRRGGSDRRALRGADVDPGVQPETAERRVIAHPER